MVKCKLVIGKYYHITTKSIAKYVIFNNEREYLRMRQLLVYYQVKDPSVRFSYFLAHQKKFDKKKSSDKEKLIRIIAYCLMPTHIHLILQQLKENGISVYMNKILNSYTRYFNTIHHRKGPLWTSRFKRILIETDEQLLHLTRYIHLNPVTSYLVDKPEDWRWSSYLEYINKIQLEEKICEFEHVLDINPSKYKKFVKDRISYQRELAKIKELILE